MMATIKLKNKSRNFMFFGSITLTGKEEKVLDTKDLNDKELATLANAIFVGSLFSDVAAIDLVKEIKDPAIRKAAIFKITGEAQPIEFNDVQKAPVVIEEVIQEEAKEEVKEEAVITEPEASEAQEVAAEVKETNLADLLSGNAAEVKRKIKEAKLSEEEKLQLAEIEQADKNRASVLDLILAEGA